MDVAGGVLSLQKPVATCSGSWWNHTENQGGREEHLRSGLPISLPTAILLGLLRVLAWVAMFGEVARKVFLRGGRAVSQAGVILVVELHNVSEPGCDTCLGYT